MQMNTHQAEPKEERKGRKAMLLLFRWSDFPDFKALKERVAHTVCVEMLAGVGEAHQCNWP